MARCCFYAVGTLALLLLVGSVTLLVARVFQKAVDQAVTQNTVLKNGTDAFGVWENPPPPVYMQFYFFNVTNPDEILQGEDPHVEEVGPYTYRELQSRENIHFEDNGTRVSAVNPKSYIFQRDLSVGDPEVDLIRTLNIPAITAMEWTKIGVLKEILEGLLKTFQQKLFVVHTVHDLLWGYKDQLFSLIHIFKQDLPPYFGLFYGKNGTDDGNYTFLTGEDNYLNFSKIVDWNQKSSLDWWASEKCNMINGTDGNSFHPLITKDEILYIFASDFCRSVYLTFSDIGNVEGIPSLRFNVPPEIFANNSDNSCFCNPSGSCVGSGVLNISVCKNGAPIFLSAPHFYQADEKFISAIKGMNPNKDDHETFLDLNPLTGIILRGAKRLQINVRVHHIDEFEETGNIKTLIFPVMYLNESVLIDKDSVSKLKSVINTTMVITNIPYIIMALGVFLGLIFTWMACKGQGSEEGTVDERAPLMRT